MPLNRSTSTAVSYVSYSLSFQKDHGRAQYRWYAPRFPFASLGPSRCLLPSTGGRHIVSLTATKPAILGVNVASSLGSLVPPARWRGPTSQGPSGLGRSTTLSIIGRTSSWLCCQLIPTQYFLERISKRPIIISLTTCLISPCLWKRWTPGLQISPAAC